MNKRIKTLAETAGFVLWDKEPWNPGDIVDWSCKYDTELQRFAELIVQECIQAIQNEGQTYKHLDAGEFQANNFSQAVKQHFGVE